MSNNTPFSQLSLFDSVPEIQSFTALTEAEYSELEVRVAQKKYSSWSVDWNYSHKRGIVSVPRLFALAPVSIKRALLDWAMLMKKRKRYWKESDRIGRVQLEELLRGYLINPGKHLEKEGIKLEGKNKLLLKSILKRNSRKIARLKPEGAFHNLNHLFDTVNAMYFDNRLRARLTWSARTGGLSTHCLEQDEEGNPYHLITISRCYDFKDVREEIVSGVVYHECLHIEIPPYTKNGRRIVHGPEFKKREREYRYYNEWVTWHHTELRKKMRTLKLRRTLQKVKKRVFGWG
ncbi:MAG: hypothetical protein HQK83_04235 [Fibrobacteria bacterium]|nr:hypothetical protein [Fibrobacteria bacterium]